MDVAVLDSQCFVFHSLPNQIVLPNAYDTYDTYDTFFFSSQKSKKTEAVEASLAGRSTIKVPDETDSAESGSDTDDAASDKGVISLEQDYARGVAVMESSSSDSDSSDLDSDEEAAVAYDQQAHSDHYWGEQDGDAETTDEPTRRLAIMNMDWDRVGAVDLLVLLNSFKPASGIVHNVKVW